MLIGKKYNSRIYGSVFVGLMIPCAIAQADEPATAEFVSDEEAEAPTFEYMALAGAVSAYVDRGELLGPSLSSPFLEAALEGTFHTGAAGDLNAGVALAAPLDDGAFDLVPYLYYGVNVADDMLSLGVGYSPTITVNEDPAVVWHEIEVSVGADFGIPVAPSIGFIAAPEAKGGYGYLRAGWEHELEPVVVSAELGLGVSGYEGTPFDLQDVTLNVGLDWRVAGPFHVNAAFSIQYGPRTNEWLPWGGLALGLWP